MIVARSLRHDDVNYILDSFLKGFRDAPWSKGVPWSTLSEFMYRLLLSDRWTTTILCDSDVPDEILAWAVWSGPQHYAWLCVKGVVQRNGLARQLVSAIGTNLNEPVYAAFCTPELVGWCRKRGIRVHFRPYEAFL